MDRDLAGQRLGLTRSHTPTATASAEVRPLVREAGRDGPESHRLDDDWTVAGPQCCPGSQEGEKWACCGGDAESRQGAASRCARSCSSIGDDYWIEDEAGQPRLPRRRQGDALARDVHPQGRGGQRGREDPGAQAQRPRQDGDRARRPHGRHGAGRRSSASATASRSTSTAADDLKAQATSSTTSTRSSATATRSRASRRSGSASATPTASRSGRARTRCAAGRGRSDRALTRN